MLQRLVLLLLAVLFVSSMPLVQGSSSLRILADDNSTTNATELHGHGKKNSTSTTNTTNATKAIPQWAEDEDDSEDSTTVATPVADFSGTTDDDDSPAPKKQKEPEHVEMEDTHNGTAISFEPPEEHEPPFWKPMVVGLFLLVSTVLCLLTAKRSCGRNGGYADIPSTTLVV